MLDKSTKTLTMSTISAGLVKTTNLTVNGLGAGAVTATNLQFENLNIPGNLSVGGSQYTYTPIDYYITLDTASAYNGVTASNPYYGFHQSASFQIKLTLNKIGNQVTINFPLMNFYIPQNPYLGSDIDLISGYLNTISSGIPEEYRPTSLVFKSALAPNGTMTENYICSTQFLGGISGNVLTVSQVEYGAPLVIGQTIMSVSPDTSGHTIIEEGSGVSGTVIIGFGTGKGGKGTYYLNNSQTINDYSRMQVETGDFSGQPINMPSYLVQVSPAGKVFISGNTINKVNKGYVTGYSGIPVGVNTILPFSITYDIKPVTNISSIGVNLNSTQVNVLNTDNWPTSSPQFNVVDCSGYSNFQFFEQYVTFNLSTRDNELMSSLNGNSYYIWADNSIQSSINFTGFYEDVMFCKSSVDPVTGVITKGEPYQLTNFSNIIGVENTTNPYFQDIMSKLNTWQNYNFDASGINNIAVFGSSVAVNTIRPWNIVAQAAPVGRNKRSYRDVKTLSWTHRFVSNDYGTTWPNEYNGPINNNPVLKDGAGDDRGVFCDMYGTFWELKSPHEWRVPGSSNKSLVISISSSKDGITWYTGFTGVCAPLSPQEQYYYDSPSISFGYDGANASVTTGVDGNQTLNCVDSSGALTLSFTLNVVDTAGFPESGSFTVADSTEVTRTIWYTGKTPNSFTGCIATDTFIGFTLNDSSIIQCLGQYGIWCINLYSTKIEPMFQTVYFIPITGPWVDQETTFTGYLGDGTGDGVEGSSSILTVTGVTSGTLVVGQQLCGQNLVVTDSSWNGLPGYNILDPDTVIVSQLTGPTGGVGTYSVSISQNVASQTVYGAVQPIGVSNSLIHPEGYYNNPMPVQTAVSETVSVIPDAKYDFTINVESTANMPCIGVISVPNGNSGSAIILYNGTTPTSLLNCSTWLKGVGSGFSLASGTTVTVPNSPCFIRSQSGQSQVTTTQNGKVFNLCTGSVLMYKSIPNPLYPDPVSSNWVGPFQVGPSSQSGLVYSGLTGTLVYDDKNQTLYSCSYQGINSNVDPNLDHKAAKCVFIFSRDNGQTWSDPIILSDHVYVGYGYQPSIPGIMNSLFLDKVNGSLNYNYYNQISSDPADFYNTSRYALNIPNTQLQGFLAGTPVVDNNYVVPPAVTPSIGGGLGVYGTMIVPQT